MFQVSVVKLQWFILIWLHRSLVFGESYWLQSAPWHIFGSCKLQYRT